MLFRSELLQNSTTREDSLLVDEQLGRVEEGLGLVKIDSASAKDSTAPAKRRTKGNKWKFGISNSEYTSLQEYDSVQRSLPKDERDNWLQRRTAVRSIELGKRLNKDEDQFWKDLLTSFIHTFPYLLFVSLPLYALWLKLLYVRRKKYYYVDHVIFLVYLYIFTFIFGLIFIAIDELEDKGKWEWLDWLILAHICWGIYYAWRAMHKFYGQGRFKTLLKFLLFNLLCLVSIILLFGLFFILTVFSI